MYNFVGQRFGKLIVLSEEPNRNKYGQYSYAELGRLYSCDSTHIRRIIIGERWK